MKEEKLKCFLYYVRKIGPNSKFLLNSPFSPLISLKTLNQSLFSHHSLLRIRTNKTFAGLVSEHCKTKLCRENLFLNSVSM